MPADYRKKYLSNNVKFASEQDTFKDKLLVQQHYHLFFRFFFDQFQGMSSITRDRFHCLLLLLCVMTLLLVGKQILQRNLKSSKRQDTAFLTESQAGVLCCHVEFKKPRRQRKAMIRFVE